MPRLSRRFATRASLAAGGTVVAGLLARKLVRGDSPQDADPPPQSLAALRADPSPEPFPRYTWDRVLPGGQTRAASIADHAGQPVLLNLWATWCEPCGREMPSLARLAAATAGRLAVLPVSLDRNGAGAVRAFYAAHRIEGLPILLDPQSEAMQALGVAALPTTFLIGADLMLRARFEGAADWSSADARAVLWRVIGS